MNQTCGRKRHADTVKSEGQQKVLNRFAKTPFGNVVGIYKAT